MSLSPDWTNSPSSAFWVAFLTYPVIHTVAYHLQSVNRAPRRRFLLANKVTGGVNAVVDCWLAIREVSQPRWRHDNLITTRSRSANAVVAVEAAYLVQDTLTILFGKRRIRAFKLTRHIMTHHLVVGALLFTYLYICRLGKEKGAFFMASYMAMNFSTPFLYIRWALREFRMSRGKDAVPGWLAWAEMVSAWSTVVAYLVARMWLLLYQLYLYGHRNGISVTAAYFTIPLQCKAGTLALAALNSLRLRQLLKEAVKSSQG